MSASTRITAEAGRTYLTEAGTRVRLVKTTAHSVTIRLPDESDYEATIGRSGFESIIESVLE